MDEADSDDDFQHAVGTSDMQTAQRSDLNLVLNAIGVKKETTRPEALEGIVNLEKLSFWPDKEEALILKEQVVSSRASYVDPNAVVKDIKKICAVLVKAPIPPCGTFLQIQKGVFNFILEQYEIIKSTDDSREEGQKLFGKDFLDGIDKKLEEYNKSFVREEERLKKAWSEVHAEEIKAFDDWKAEAKKRTEDQIQKMRGKEVQTLLLKKVSIEAEQFQVSIYNRCMNNVVLLNENVKNEPEEAQYNKQAYKKAAVERMIACKGDAEHPIDILAEDYTPNASMGEIPKKKETKTPVDQEAEKAKKVVEAKPAEKSKSPKKVNVVTREVKQKQEDDISNAKEAVKTAEKALAEAKEKLQIDVDAKAQIDNEIREKKELRGPLTGQERDNCSDRLYNLTQEGNKLD